MLPAGVHVFERGWLSANNVLVVGRQSTALVDSGYASHAAQTVGLVRSRLRDRALDTLVNTHLHSDHCGGNRALQDAYPGLRTFIPPGLAEQVREWDPVALTYVPTGQQCPRFAFNGVVSPGESVCLGDGEWEVHAAPGHDPHSVVLFEPVTRSLLSADALWENGFGVIFPELEGDRAFDEAAATLDLIEQLRPTVVVPGHGRVFTEVASALVRARSRLAAYRSDPRKHAAHAAKVLLKFKLLELGPTTVEQFTRWALVTPYMRMVQERWFPQSELIDLLNRFIQELAAAGAVRVDGDCISNG